MARPRRRSSSRRRASRGRSAGTASRRGTRQQRSLDLDVFTAQVAEEVVPRLGLDILGLSKEEYIEMLKPIVAGIVEQYSSRPSKQAVAQRLVSNPDPVYRMAAAYVLEKRDELSEDQIEFIASNAPDIAARYVSKLYREATRLGRGGVLPLLRSAWERYGRPSAIQCPRCGFRAVTPDLVCMVCGHELSEREAKETIDFRERLKELAEFYGPAAAREAAERGYVIVGEFVKPPSAGLGEGEVVLHLSEEERELLRKLASALSVARR